MIKFGPNSLPYSEPVYIAFRIAFLETQERLALAEQLELGGHRSFGYLTLVPFLKNVPAQVQLDLLLDLWDKHLSRETYSASYLDEAIVYAACETAATLVRSDLRQAEKIISSGPLRSELQPTPKLADKLQQLHLDFAFQGHFLLMSQFQDLPLEEATAMKEEFGIIDGKCDGMFDALGRWHVYSGFEDRACGLLTDPEIEGLSSLVDFTRSARGLKK